MMKFFRNIIARILINQAYNLCLKVWAPSATSAPYWLHLLNIFRENPARMWHLPFASVYEALEVNCPYHDESRLEAPNPCGWWSFGYAAGNS